jgi:hypothetical protein
MGLSVIVVSQRSPMRLERFTAYVPSSQIVCTRSRGFPSQVVQHSALGRETYQHQPEQS